MLGDGLAERHRAQPGCVLVLASPERGHRRLADHLRPVEVGKALAQVHRAGAGGERAELGEHRGLQRPHASGSLHGPGRYHPSPVLTGQGSSSTCFAPAAMDRTERLLDLVALLLDAHEPVSWAELKESFPEDYGSGSDEATERKFERDKAELLELGIPLTYVQGDEDRKDGYLLDRSAYYLPEPRIHPRGDGGAVRRRLGRAGLRARSPAGTTSSTRCGRSASSPEASSPRPAFGWSWARSARRAALPEHLETLWTAASARKWVELVYASPKSPQPSTRKVDPYGLVLRRGVWSLVGYCHLRQGLRTFHVHRIRALKMNGSKPRTSRLRGAGGFRHRRTCAARPVAVGHRAAGRGAPRAAGSARHAGRGALPRRTAGAPGRHAPRSCSRSRSSTRS